MGEPSVQMMTPGETPLGPRLPLRMGRFVLCEELGSGGMATVYLSRMQLAAGIERLVALKTIHPHLAKEKPFVDMFLDEARIASHVTHPNVCSTHDFGEVESVYYLAMEYLLGEPVFNVINSLVDRFDEVKEVLPYIAARIVADACEGLHAAHGARGPDGEPLHIVHRDVSPQNLFLTYDGAVKVVDFGCAKAAERVAHTSTGVMKGKVGYASPEQIKGYEADARADVWSLGVCLWETLTLSPLFSRETAVATAMAVLEDPIELANDGRDWIPEEVALIADRALSRNVEERYQSAREMSRALRKFIADGGYTLESAELAEWMEFLFEERHAESVRKMSRVQEMDISDAALVSVYEVNADDVEILDSAAALLEAMPYDDEGEPPEVTGPMPKAQRRVGMAAEEIDPPPRATWSSGRTTVMVLSALVLLLIGGYYLQYYYEPAPWFLELFGMAEARPTPTAAHPTVEPTVGATREPTQRRSSRAIEAPASGTADPRANGAIDPAASERTAPTDGESAEAIANARRRRERGGGSITTVVSGGGESYAAGAPVAPTVSSEPRPHEGELGSLHIDASPGYAVVFEGGRRLGRTPLDIQLPVGAHSLRVHPNGDADRAESVTVDISGGVTGETVSLDIPRE